MKYLKKFENFDLGRFSNEDEDNHEWVEDVEDVEDDEYDTLENEDDEDEDEIEDEENEMRRRVWGDEVVEKKSTKSSYKKSGLKNPKKADLDKDGKISGYEKKRGKAVQKAVQGEKEEKGKESKELTAAQKKLPEGLRKAIEKKNKKK